MSNLTLCVGKASETPYYLEDICLNIYSVEELCYYLCENTDMLEKSLMKEDLCRFIEAQPGYGKLGRLLAGMVRSGCTLADFVTEILRETFCCGEERVGEIRRILTETEDMDYLKRRKRKGDYFFEAGRYALAIGEYADILSVTAGLGEETLPGEALHNMGAAYARIFDFKNASDCFKKAYGQNHREESLKQYLAALRFGKTKEQYLRYLKEHRLNGETAVRLEEEIEEKMLERQDSANARSIAEIHALKKEGRVIRYYEAVNRTLEDWKNSYRKNMMNL